MATQETKIELGNQRGVTALAVEAEKFLKAVYSGEVKEASLAYGEVRVVASLPVEKPAEPASKKA
jgi:hypothetical protein